MTHTNGTYAVIPFLPKSIMIWIRLVVVRDFFFVFPKRSLTGDAEVTVVDGSFSCIVTLRRSSTVVLLVAAAAKFNAIDAHELSTY